MDFLSLAKARYSCRKYKPDPVPTEVLDKILEAGRVSPSAHNNQPYRLIVVQSPEGLEKVRKTGKVYTSPVAIIVCGHTGEAWENNFDSRKSTETDAAIVTDHMMLEAASLGVASLWMCWFDRAEIKRDFALDDQLDPISILLLGYAEGEARSPERHDQYRRKLDELVEHR